jgi:hypothetical protein
MNIGVQDPASSDGCDLSDLSDEELLEAIRKTSKKTRCIRPSAFPAKRTAKTSILTMAYCPSVKPS